jgi:hypothetical protein
MTTRKRERRMLTPVRTLLTLSLCVCWLGACGRFGYQPQGQGDSGADGSLVIDMSASDMGDDDAADPDGGAAALIVTPTTGLVTTELGGSATFTVVLGSQPVSNVIVGIDSSDETEGLASPSSLTFTTVDWNAPKVVTVSGVDDFETDGNQAYTVLTAAAVSADVSYSGLDAADVSVSNTDNETPGVTLSRRDGVVTTESGGADTFTIVLNTAPSADVTIELESDTPTEATASPSSVTFTVANWGSPQTITVQGVDDSVQDGDATFVIVTEPAMSADPNYGTVNPDDVAGSNLDDESAGILVMPTSGLLTSEGGATAAFTVALQSQPIEDVVISVVSDDPSEGSVPMATLTFTALTWNMAQAVTVTGVDDALADGDQAYAIHVGPATSGDPSYDGLAGSDVFVTNTDDESAGFTTTPNAGLVTTEGGGTATFTVVLNSLPIAAVVFDVATTRATEGAVSPTSLTFTTADWNVPQTVTLTGVDDAVADGGQSYEAVVHVSSSADPAYLALSDRRVAATNVDNESAGITVLPTSGLTTTESGGTATFTIVLNSEPTASVSVSLASDAPLEGTALPTSVTFTTVDWNIPQTITVTGVDDFVVDGARVYHLVTAPATSADTNYNGVNASDVTVTNTDNDVAGVSVTPTSGLTTSEAGASAMFTIVLTSEPTAGVTIGVASSDSTEGSLSVTSVVFSSANWNVPQAVVVEGVDDSLADGNVGYSIVTANALSGDAAYSGVDPSDVSLSNLDNDTASVVVTPSSGLVTTEAGGSASFTVVLTAQPSTAVSITLMSTDVSEGTVSTASVMFTNGDWNMPQTVTVTGVDDASADGDIVYTLALGAVVSSDSAFSGLAVDDVGITNIDNDTAGIAVTPTSGLVTSEAGSTATFAVALTSQPSANVTFSIVSSDATEGTVAPASLTFTMGNWNVAQTVTLTGVDDVMADGNIGYTIVTGAATSSDSGYSGLAVPDVSATNNDNDAPGVTVSPVAGLLTTEGGGVATFTIVLASLPSASVTVSLATSDASEGTVSGASVTFTTMNWSVPQTVTVTGVDDAVADGNIAYSITTGNSTSADGSYNGLVVSDVAVTNNDNDTAGVTVSPTSGLVTTEVGGTAMFTVVLTSEPTADVAFSMTSSDTTEGTVSPATLTFTALNWNVPQTVTVTGVDDSFFDANVAYSILTGAGVSIDLAYSGRDPADVALTNTNNEVPPYLQQAYVKASNTGAGDYFSESFSLSGDGNTLAVAALNEDSSATGVGGNQADNSAAAAGAVYVFTRSGSTWTQQAYIKASNTDANDFFGSAVAISNDGNTLAVGAYDERSSATGIDGNQASNSVNIAGAAYVFTRTGATWTQQAYVKASNTGSNDYFGSFVELSADGSTLAVAAEGEASAAAGINGNQLNNGRANAGAVYVFKRTTGVWAQEAYIKASNPDSGDGFGAALAIADDGNTLAVSTYNESSNATGIGGTQADNSAPQAGATYVFVRAVATWSQQAYVKASNTETLDGFGGSIALSADGNTLAVGALGEDSNAVGIGGAQGNNLSSFSGATYVFTRSGTVWSQQAYIKSAHSSAGDGFGASVALSADGNTLAVAATGEDSAAQGVSGDDQDETLPNSGALFTFRRSGSTWTQYAYIKASNPDAVDRFGQGPTSMSADGQTVAVGTLYESSNATGIDGNQADNSAASAGAVYVFVGS